MGGLMTGLATLTTLSRPTLSADPLSLSPSLSLHSLSVSLSLSLSAQNPHLIGQLALAFNNLAVAFAHIGFGAQQIGLQQLDLRDQLDLVLCQGWGRRDGRWGQCGHNIGIRS
jgi:hypothetical protein